MNTLSEMFLLSSKHPTNSLTYPGVCAVLTTFRHARNVYIRATGLATHGY